MRKEKSVENNKGWPYHGSFCSPITDSIGFCMFSGERMENMLAKKGKERTKWIKERKSRFNLLCSLALLFFVFCFALLLLRYRTKCVDAGAEKRRGTNIISLSCSKTWPSPKWEKRQGMHSNCHKNRYASTENEIGRSEGWGMVGEIDVSWIISWKKKSVVVVARFIISPHPNKRNAVTLRHHRKSVLVEIASQFSNGWRLRISWEHRWLVVAATILFQKWYSWNAR